MNKLNNDSTMNYPTNLKSITLKSQYLHNPLMKQSKVNTDHSQCPAEPFVKTLFDHFLSIFNCVKNMNPFKHFNN